MNEERYQIDVRVEPAYLAEQSDPDEDRYAFSYTVTLENTGAVGARLRSRRWVITDSDGHVQKVQGEGVVGEQPYLEPGERYQYTSGALLKAPVGTMEGSYHMVADDGTEFDTPIPRFTLAGPRVLH